MRLATFIQIAKRGDVMLAAVNAGLHRPKPAVAASIADRLVGIAQKRGKVANREELIAAMRKAAAPNKVLDKWGRPVVASAAPLRVVK